MEKAMYNRITDENYAGVVSVLDYEASLKMCMSDIGFLIKNQSKRKILVDLALKVGINKYRFVEYDVSDDGKILWNSSSYVVPCENIVNLANSFIRKKKDVLSNSMLPTAMQNLFMEN